MWDLFEIIPIDSVFVDNCAFLWWKVTHVILYHLEWGDIWDSVGSSISIILVLKYTSVLDLRRQIFLSYQRSGLLWQEE